MISVATTFRILHIILSSYHVQLSLSIERDGEDERSNDAAGHGVVGVDDGTVLAVPLSQSTIEARPEQPQKQCTCTELEL
jgi:hypothetical protein